MPLFVVNYGVESEPGLSDISRLMRSAPFCSITSHVWSPYFIFNLLLVTTHEVIYLFVDSLGARNGRWREEVVTFYLLYEKDDDVLAQQLPLETRGQLRHVHGI